MKLQVMNCLEVENPTEGQVSDAVLGMRTSFVILTDETNNYLQAAGGRPWCLVERRQTSPLGHFRAYRPTPTPKYKNGARLSTGAGEITMQHDEWFLQKEAVEIFLAFLRGERLPSAVQWRSLNEMFGI